LFYEFFGIVTNLVGGWLAARLGLNTTMHIGLVLQILALSMLLVSPTYLSVGYVMLAQAISGIAKDLNKMSAKSSIKMLFPNESQGKLYRWVSLLTGSKNTLKGVGFFVGALLLTLIGFRKVIFAMVVGLVIILMFSYYYLNKQLGVSQYTPKFREIFSTSRAINYLSAARLFLFGARDIWFVVALPVYLDGVLDWGHEEIGMFMALWVIGYGIVQSLAPSITQYFSKQPPNGNTAVLWSGLLLFTPLFIIAGLYYDLNPSKVIIFGLVVFGIVFAINSALHSYLVIAYAKEDGVSLDVGFYYMANAAGRLLGTVASGLIYQYYGLMACLLMSSLFISICYVLSKHLPQKKPLYHRVGSVE